MNSITVDVIKESMDSREIRVRELNEIIADYEKSISAYQATIKDQQMKIEKTEAIIKTKMREREIYQTEIIRLQEDIEPSNNPFHLGP